MKNKKGFTLVELLAVIVVISVVAAIGTLSLIGIKNKAADDTFNKLEKQIVDLGPEIYTHEILLGDKEASQGFYRKYKSGDDFYVELSELKDKGYISDIKSPYNGSDACDGYLLFKKNGKKYDYKAYLSCSDKKTSNYDEALDDESIEEITISSIKD